MMNEMGILGHRLLLSRCAQDDPAAWDRLLSIYWQPLVKYVQRQLGPPRAGDLLLVEEVVNGVFCSLLAGFNDRLAQYHEDDGSSWVYLTQLAYRALYRYRRSEGRRHRREHRAALPEVEVREPTFAEVCLELTGLLGVLTRREMEYA
jgi:hypothetical protein